MQSGISVSPELQTAFTTFTTTPTQFCLPVTIQSERLTPLPPLAFTSPSNDFYASLPQLAGILEPKTPIYLLLRRPATIGTGELLALTYIPSNAGVRHKTLFAATRATLARELGTEKFAATIFATDEEEVVGEEAWREREAEQKNPSGRGVGGAAREELMGEKERELEAVRRAEEEARSGTPGRDIGIGGTFQRAAGSLFASGGTGGGASGMRIQMHVDEEVKAALGGLQMGGLVQLAIEVKSEAFKVAVAESGVDATAVQSHIPDNAPRYTFYHYPDSEVVIFIYTCPSGSSIRERMLYASSRMHALAMAEEQGLKISKKIEASSPDEISAERLQEEVQPPQHTGPSRGFARPRRPGR
ncbi:twinfilin [Aspergillus saccharolyticus JOP 1030-1]|uniref:Twinfilin n=1 Tax=Aspergillus saccharolyticus JOP 1030-1 TaxID=1450539 RepID=A0A319AFX3_9EURO|nr:actin depolymerizing protein [Aspergillus saccharolyticus JOP 1030-1]PYH45622.1 actin depolymerizing protein [Aspergillus saccharolyticus JOP 1030-1]